MAHARTTNKDATLISQLARGRRTRDTFQKWVQIATDRGADDAESALVADIIRNQTVVVPLGVAPCDGKILRCTANATQWVEIATSGTVTATFYKAVIGASDVALTSALTISWVTAGTPLTAETAYDATLVTTSGVLDVIEGQHVYVSIAVSDHAIAAKSLGLLLEVEWVPTDLGYPFS